MVLDLGHPCAVGGAIQEELLVQVRKGQGHGDHTASWGVRDVGVGASWLEQGG